MIFVFIKEKKEKIKNFFIKKAFRFYAKGFLQEENEEVRSYFSKLILAVLVKSPAWMR